jgi:hypothetical protein
MNAIKKLIDPPSILEQVNTKVSGDYTTKIECGRRSRLFYLHHKALSSCYFGTFS